MLVSSYHIQSSIQAETKFTSGLKAGNSCYYPVLTLLSSRIFSNNMKIKIRAYKTIILPVMLYGFETWSLTLKEEFWLRVFENRFLI